LACSERCLRASMTLADVRRSSNRTWLVIAQATSS
jgi:hypothetical protein